MLLKLSRAVECAPLRRSPGTGSQCPLAINVERKHWIKKKNGLKSGLKTVLTPLSQLLSNLLLAKAVSSVFQLQIGMEMSHSTETHLEHWLCQCKVTMNSVF